MSTSWPPALKTWVNTVFAQCTPLSRPRVEAELKSIIHSAYVAGTLNTVDWPSVQLPPPLPTAGPSKPKPIVTPAVTPQKKLKRKKPAADSTSFAYTDPATLTVTGEDASLRQKRARRFQLDQQQHLSKTAWSPAAHTPEPDAVYDANVIDWDKHTIVGTSTALEKSYLRLTTVPDPATIRPLPVLRQALAMLKRRWREEGNYAYICDQFKSLRQDLTVQRIKNEDTVMVYEIHARIALEKGDLGEYNQCQSMLRPLYAYAIPGHPEEFCAYRILYLLHTRNRSDLNTMLSTLTAKERADEGVAHALQVRLAMATSNYVRLFALYSTAPKMGGYLMDHFIPRERLTALVAIAKAYQTVPLDFLSRQLGYATAEDCDAFLGSHAAANYRPVAGQTVFAARSQPAAQRVFDCQPSRAALNAALSSASRVDIKGQI